MSLKTHNRYDYSPIFERPNFDWPGGKRVAFYVALNIENFHFGEGLGHTPTALGVQPDVRNFAWRDYGLRVGIWRIFDMMDELGLPMCHLLNAAVCEKMPQIPNRIKQRGDEVVGHGFTNSERQSDMDEPAERKMIHNATEVLERACGKRPYGWMGPWIAETYVTPDLLKEAGYKFIMDWPADDQPFWMRTRSGPIMSVPYPIEINDSPVMLSRMQPATDFNRMILDQFEEILHQSEKSPLVCGISLHTFCAGQPFRLIQIRQALRTIISHPDFSKVWVTTPGQIADYCDTLPANTIT